MLDRGFWEKERFKDNGDETITDIDSGLTWTKNANMGYMTWDEALNLVESMNHGSGKYGCKKWQLPHRIYLEGLKQAKPDGYWNNSKGVYVVKDIEEHEWIEMQGFENVRPDGYWAIVNSNKKHVVIILPCDDEDFYSSFDYYYVWPVCHDEKKLEFHRKQRELEEAQRKKLYEQQRELEKQRENKRREVQKETELVSKFRASYVPLIAAISGFICSFSNSSVVNFLYGAFGAGIVSYLLSKFIVKSFLGIGINLSMFPKSLIQIGTIGIVILTITSHADKKPVIDITKSVVAAGLNTKQKPVDIDTSFSPGKKKLYYYVSYKASIPGNTVFLFMWYKDGNLISKNEFTSKYVNGNVCSYLDYDYQPGQYEVQIHAHGNQLSKTSFSVAVEQVVKPTDIIVPDIPYKNIDACPFEGCMYGKWVAAKETSIFKSMDDNSPIAFTVEVGDNVTAISGVVITEKLCRARLTKKVKFADAEIYKGQIVYLLFYEGEGDWKAWHQRKENSLFEGDFEFIDKCETVWWVNIINNNGQSGWTNAPMNFDGKDRFGFWYHPIQTLLHYSSIVTVPYYV